MITHNISPVLVSFLGLEIRYYGLIYAIGFIVVYLVLQNFAKKNLIKNLNYSRVDEYVLYVILSIIVGARAGYVLFYNLSFFIQNPQEIIMMWHGGMSFHGGLIALILVSYFFCKKYKISFLRLADVVSIPVCFVLFLGRIANFINAELIGRVMNHEKWYCIDYSNYGIQGCRHPSQIYEALKNLFNGFVLLGLNNYVFKNKKKYEGLLFFSFIALYGLLRFLTNFYREDPAILLGIGTGQFLSLLMFIAGISLIIWKLRKRK